MTLKLQIRYFFNDDGRDPLEEYNILYNYIVVEHLSLLLLNPISLSNFLEIILQQKNSKIS